MASHILPTRVYYTIYAILLFCTYLTVQIAFFDLGVLTLRSGENSIRFRPPLDITAEVIDEAMDAMRKYCRKRK